MSAFKRSSGEIREKTYPRLRGEWLEALGSLAESGELFVRPREVQLMKREISEGITGEQAAKHITEEHQVVRPPEVEPIITAPHRTKR